LVVRDQYVINNNDKFFHDLPELTKKRDLKALSRLPEYRIGKDESEIKRLKLLKAKIEGKIQEKGELIKL
jgi:hypothetical protein